MAEFLCHPSAYHFMDDNSATDDGEIGLQRRVPPESSQDVGIVCQQGQKNVGCQIVNVVSGEGNTAGVGRVLDHLDEESGKSVNECLPAARFAFQTA